MASSDCTSAGRWSALARGSLVLVAILAAPARAHLGPVSGTMPFVVDGELTGGASTWGIVLIDDDGAARRVCEEAFGETPAFHWMTRDGRVLIGGTSGLFATTDGGCTFARVAGPHDGQPTIALAVARDAPEAIVLVTSSAAFRSDDEGLTFSAAAAIDGAPVLRDVALSPDGATVIITGLDVATGAPVVAVSTDAGASFIRAARADLARLVVLAVDDEGGAYFAAIPSTGPGALEKRDAGGTFTTVTTFAGTVTDAVVFQGRPRVIVSRLSYHSPDDAGVWAPVVGAPSGCLVQPPGSAALWGCGRLADFVHFLSSDDGLTFTGALPYGVVEERVCPIGTPGRERCAFGDGGILLDGGTPPTPDAGGAADAGPGPTPPTCGCGAARASSSSSALSLLLALVALSARRGSRPGPSPSGSPSGRAGGPST